MTYCTRWQNKVIGLRGSSHLTHTSTAVYLNRYGLEIGVQKQSYISKMVIPAH